MKNAKPSNRIRELRKEANLTQEELGGQMPSELTGTTVAKLESGRMRLSLEYAQEIADVLGVSFLEVLGVDETGVRVVPLVGAISAGNWREAIEVSDRTIAIPGHLRGKDLFGLEAEGDSMNMIVADGGHVVVDPNQTELIDGKLYAVMNGDGETTFKRFSSDPLQLEPCSTNEQNQPILIGTSPFTVLGRVVYAGQEL